MCGIAGGAGLVPPTQIQLIKQLDLIGHRGPDGRGEKFGINFSLGMCRLSIVEIQDGAQPVSDKSGKIHLVFNGEIYNYKELQNKYFLTGQELMNNSEAALLIGLYKKYGIEFVKLIEGMFAIAVYDEIKEELLLIRDRVGKKPLCYSILSSKTIYFASETKALLEILPTKTLRKSALTEVMTFGYVLGPGTAFSEIEFLPPGYIGKFKHGKWEMQRYWEPNYEETIKIDYSEAKEETKRLIFNSVERRLVSERPLGAFLSGGIDSTVITAIMSQISPGYVNTFSIGFKDKNYDESRYAESIAQFLGTHHKTKVVEPNPLALIEKISKTLDQPFADSSIIPTFELAELAVKDVVVALGGDGGDEIFGGYDRYRATPVLQKYNSIHSMLGPVGALLSKSVLIKNRSTKRLLSEMGSRPTLAASYRSIMSLTKSNILQNLLDPNLFDKEIIDSFDEDFDLIGTKDDLSKMLRLDFIRYLPGDLLVKADLASMAHGLELRSPLLDVQLIEWVNSLPSDFKIKGGETKRILKDIARDLVPSKLIDRPKMGFAIPRASWLRNELSEISHDLLTDSIAKDRGWFNQSEVKNTLYSHAKGSDQDSVIWPMMMLELWARNWLD